MKLIKQNIPFTMVANEVLYRKDLSAKGKGMFAYLFSKPNDWDFSSDRIAREMKEGRKGVQAMLRELISVGLLKRQKLSDGRMDYAITYADSQSPQRGLRLFDPKVSIGTEQNGHGAKMGLISNTEEDSNKEGETPAELARGFFSGEIWVRGEIMRDLYAKVPVEIADREVLKFMSYWTEPNKSGTKVRWELERTFDVRRRLATWFSRVQQFSPRGRVTTGRGIA